MRYLDKLEEAKVDKGKPYGEKTRARSRRDLDRALQHTYDTGEGKVGKMVRSKDFRKTSVQAARVNRKEGLPSSRPLKGIVKAEKKLKEAYKLIGLALIEAKVDKGLTPQQKIAARIQRGNDAPDELAQKTRTGPVGDMARSKAQRKARVQIAKAENKSPKTKKAKTFAKNKEREAALKNLKASNKFYKREDAHTSYQQIGAILAEAISKAVMSSPSTRKKRLDRRMDVVSGRIKKVTGGDDYKYSRSAQKLTGDSEEMRTSKRRDEGLSEGIRSKVADKLDKFSRKQYRKGEVDDASGKPKRAGLRGRAAHAAGKLSQKVRPRDKS